MVVETLVPHHGFLRFHLEKLVHRSSGIVCMVRYASLSFWSNFFAVRVRREHLEQFFDKVFRILPEPRFDVFACTGSSDASDFRSVFSPLSAVASASPTSEMASFAVFSN